MRIPAQYKGEKLSPDWIGMSAKTKRLPHVNPLPQGDLLGREIRRQVKVARTMNWTPRTTAEEPRPRGFVPRLDIKKLNGTGTHDWALFLDGEPREEGLTKHEAETLLKHYRRLLCLTRW